MSSISPDRFTESLEPLEFGAGDISIACTPAAIDLAAVGFAAAGFGYFAAKAYYHNRNGGYDEREGLLDGGAARHQALSASELLSVRADELTKS
ncbi:hypothetical protein AB0F15_30715 [Amycolatopsis sp. NPDC026612]|uniref:hypothetical protein n=1 Tax=Amycolatopsis sp. NPDC026612 TaxID=3155466 RepID=UPI0033E76F71